MAATALTVRQVDRSTETALALVTGDAVDGNSFVNTGREILLLKRNSGDGTGTTTVAVQQTVDGQAVADKSFEIEADSMLAVGPFPKDTYNDANGKVQLTHDDALTEMVVLRT